MKFKEFSLEFAKNRKLKWLESRIIDWELIAPNFIYQIINGKKVLIITDYKRRWVSEFIIQKVNNFQDNKPSFIPIFNLLELVPQLAYAKTDTHFEMIEDMLNISFNEEFIFWYIGTENEYIKITDIKKDESMFWIFDKEVYGNFYFNSLDVNLDKKIIDLVDLFNETLKAAIYGEIEFE